MARLVFQRTEIAGTESDQGKRLFRNGGYDQFPNFSSFHSFTGFRIHHLYDEVILVQMHSRLVKTFAGYARSHYLAKAVIICGLYIKAILNLLAHFFGPRFPGKHDILESKRLGIDPHLFHTLGNNKGIRRGCHQRRGPVVLHDRHLPFSPSHRGRKYGCTDKLGAIVKAQTSCQESII